MKNLKQFIDIKYTYISDNLVKYDYYRSILDNDEIKKADRFYFQKDRNCYTVARALLKIFLAEYLELNTNNIDFKYNDYGKPFIDSDLKFNISHSGEIIIFAFTLNNDLGIDIEFMKDNIKYKQLISRYFSKNEIKDFLSIEDNFQKEAFFNGWSRKEAYIKAVGKGLNIPLDSFDVSIKNTENVEIIAINQEVNTQWNLFDLKIDQKYKSALVVNSFDKSLNIIR